MKAKKRALGAIAETMTDQAVVEAESEVHDTLLAERERAVGQNRLTEWRRSLEAEVVAALASEGLDREYVRQTIAADIEAHPTGRSRIETWAYLVRIAARSNTLGDLVAGLTPSDR